MILIIILHGSLGSLGLSGPHSYNWGCNCAEPSVASLVLSRPGLRNVASVGEGCFSTSFVWHGLFHKITQEQNGVNVSFHTKGGR